MLKLRSYSSKAKKDVTIFVQQVIYFNYTSIIPRMKKYWFKVDKDSHFIPDNFFCMSISFEKLSLTLPRGQDSSVKLRAVVQFQ